MDHNGFSNFEFLDKIAQFLLKVNEARLNRSNPEYTLRTTNLKGNIIAKLFYKLSFIWY